MNKTTLLPMDVLRYYVSRMPDLLQGRLFVRGNEMHRRNLSLLYLSHELCFFTQVRQYAIVESKTLRNNWYELPITRIMAAMGNKSTPTIETTTKGVFLTCKTSQRLEKVVLESPLQDMHGKVEIQEKGRWPSPRTVTRLRSLTKDTPADNVKLLITEGEIFRVFHDGSVKFLGFGKQLPKTLTLELTLAQLRRFVTEDNYNLHTWRGLVGNVRKIPKINEECFAFLPTIVSF